MELKVRQLQAKLGELEYHKNTNTKHIENLMPLLEIKHDPDKDMRTCLAEYIFDAWNKEYKDVFTRRAEWMKQSDV